MFFLFLNCMAGVCLFKQLKSRYGEQVPQDATTNDEDDLSGVEVDSPHKTLSTAQEFPCELPGVGVVRTRWVGQRGVSDIRRSISQQMSEEQGRAIQTLSNDIKKLASTCHKAFEVAGLLDSADEQIQCAVALCKCHLSETKERKKVTSAISSLWKGEAGEVHSSLDPSTRAESVLGTNLVEKLTEKNREPPDVSNIQHVHLVLLHHCTCITLLKLYTHALHCMYFHNYYDFVPEIFLHIYCTCTHMPLYYFRNSYCLVLENFHLVLPPCAGNFPTHLHVHTCICITSTILTTLCRKFSYTFTVYTCICITSAILTALCWKISI